MDALRPCLASLAALRSSLVTLALSLEGAKARAFEVPLARDGSPAGEAPVQACIENDEEPRGSTAPAELWDRPIPVHAVEGRQGERLCKAALVKITRRRDQPPTRPDRRPGLIWLPGDRGRAARSAARTVNSLKEALKATVDGLDLNPKQRVRLLQGTPLHHVLLLQAYRAIQVIGAEPVFDRRDPTRVVKENLFEIEAVSFSWSGASRKVLQLSRDEVLAYLENCKLFDWESIWQSRIRRLPDPAFALVRRIAPFPVANLRVDGHWTRVMASTPLIYTGSSWPEVRDLPDYVPGAEPGQQKRAAVRVEETPLIPQIGLYRYTS